MSYFDTNSFDFKVTRGDVFNLPFEFYDEDGSTVDISVFFMRFSVRDPVTRKIIPYMSKEHNDTINGGAGIYYYADTQKWSGLNLTENNRVQIVLDSADTEQLDPGVFAYDIEVSLDIDEKTQRKTVVHGALIVVEDVTIHGV